MGQRDRHGHRWRWLREEQRKARDTRRLVVVRLLDWCDRLLHGGPPCRLRDELKSHGSQSVLADDGHLLVLRIERVMDVARLRGGGIHCCCRMFDHGG
jgi:hypothetical protein